MRLLLDTHVLLWALSDVVRLNKQTDSLLRDPGNEVFLSAASVWEIAIKKNQNRLRAPDNLVKIAIERGFTSLPISFSHAEAAGALPMHHRDPFDRMLVAQATIEDLVLLTDDPHIPRYGIRTLKAAR